MEVIGNMGLDGIFPIGQSFITNTRHISTGLRNKIIKYKPVDIPECLVLSFQVCIYLKILCIETVIESIYVHKIFLLYKPSMIIFVMMSKVTLFPHSLRSFLSVSGHLKEVGTE